MTFRKLAFKNVQGNWRQYSAFFLSSVFSVMIFYIFSAFIYHPDVVNGTIRAADKVRQGLVACQYIILVFSFFFVLYSISAFLKSRKKEFGLLSLFGMTSGQMKRMVIYENVFISLLSIGAGIGLGALFSKLFFMALAELMHVNSPIRFLVPGTALWLTAGWFFLLFQVITVLTLWKVGRSQIIDLLHAASKPKTLPKFSPVLVAIALLCLAGGYYLAYIMTVSTLILFVLPILSLVMVGTYFLFTQMSVAFLRLLQNRRPLYYKKTNLVTISSMIFKMKDNARVLFMVSILSAVILTASATFYVFFQDMKNQLTGQNPQTIGYIEKGLNAHRVFDPVRLEQLFREENLEVDYKLDIVGLPVTLKKQSNFKRNLLIVSESAFNEQAARMPDMKPVQAERDHAAYIVPYEGNSAELGAGDTFKTSIGTTEINLQIDSERVSVIGPHLGYGLLVVDDMQFGEWFKQVKDEDKVVMKGYLLKNWESISPDFAEKLRQIVGKDDEGRDLYYNYMVSNYLDARQFSSLTMFVGLFVSVLFFIASGSMLYFKMFTELGEDQRQYAGLARIGMSRKEISRTVTSQIGILFFVPCAVGVVHTVYAMKALGNVMNTNAMGYAAIVVGIYMVMQFLYFLLARNSYLTKLMPSS